MYCAIHVSYIHTYERRQSCLLKKVREYSTGKGVLATREIQTSSYNFFFLENKK